MSTEKNGGHQRAWALGGKIGAALIGIAGFVATALAIYDRYSMRPDLEATILVSSYERPPPAPAVVWELKYGAPDEPSPSTVPARVGNNPATSSKGGAVTEPKEALSSVYEAGKKSDAEYYARLNKWVHDVRVYGFATIIIENTGGAPAEGVTVYLPQVMPFEILRVDQPLPTVEHFRNRIDVGTISPGDSIAIKAWPETYPKMPDFGGQVLIAHNAGYASVKVIGEQNLRVLRVGRRAFIFEPLRFVLLSIVAGCFVLMTWSRRKPRDRAAPVK